MKTNQKLQYQHCSYEIDTQNYRGEAIIQTQQLIKSLGGGAYPAGGRGYSTLHYSSLVLCKNYDDSDSGNGDSGEVVDSDEDYHFYDTGDDNDGCLITNQYNCRDFETFKPCTVFSDRISFVDC